MGKETLGYPGMFSLGYSYAKGQWALHEANIPADPSDPGLPHPAYLDAFYDAALDVNWDRSQWTQSDQDWYHAKALADAHGSQPVVIDNVQADNGRPNTSPAAGPQTTYAPGRIRRLWGAYLANGPIPVDVEQDPTAGFDGWKDADNITAERHVYFFEKYAIDARNSGDPIPLPSWAKFLQIQGFSMSLGIPKGMTDPGAWVLPREFSSGGQQVFAWRYAADHAGPPYGDTYKATFDYQLWSLQSSGDLIAWAIAVIGVVLSILTFGAAAPGAIVAAGAAVGITVSLAEAAIIVTMLDGVVIGVLEFAVTGDSAQLMGALSKLGGEVMKLSPQALAAAEAQFPDATSFAKNVAAKISDVTDQAKALLAAGQDEITAFTTKAKDLAASFPLVDGNYWNLAKTVTGGQFAPASYFFNLARMAPSVSELQALASNAPWYAQGHVQYGATIRAVEIQQTALWLKGAGYGAHVLPPKFDPSAMMAAPLPKPSAQGQAISVMFTPIAPAKSPSQKLAGAKTSAAISAPVIAVAGLGLAWALGWLKFLL